MNPTPEQLREALGIQPPLVQNDKPLDDTSLSLPAYQIEEIKAVLSELPAKHVYHLIGYLLAAKPKE